MNEVSKIGQSEEIIEGRIVGQFEGPGGYWARINEQMEEIVRRQMQEREERLYRASRMFVATDGTWQDIGTAGTIQYERGPGWDEVFSGKHTYWGEPQTVTTEFAWADISDEAFRRMTGYDKNVLTAAQKLADKVPTPPVDIDAVKWPGPRAKAPERWDWLI